MNRAPLALGKIKKRLTVANVVSLMALCVALGGTSYAATVITSMNVKNETLTSADVKNRSLLERDFKLGQLPAGPRGPAGSQGPAGQEGPAGSQGQRVRRGQQAPGDQWDRTARTGRRATPARPSAGRARPEG